MIRAKVKLGVIDAIKGSNVITSSMINNNCLVITENTKLFDLITKDNIDVFVEALYNKFNVVFSVEELNELLNKDTLKDIIDYIYNFLEPFPDALETIIN